jgi:nucleotide-binding universal stress UspA family protein
MAIFNKILFPVDLSEASKKMVPYVKEVVDRFGAELHIIHATTAQYHIAEFVNETRLIDMEEEEKNIRGFIGSHFKNLSIQSKILPGPPGPGIIQYSKEEKLDLIIMGHSSTGIARAVFGSVAGYVVKHSHVPVLIISSGILEHHT